MKSPRLLVCAAFVVVAVLRLVTLARDPWEWDEVLFTQAVREGLDVRLSHPHPPGYPIFIRLGQGIRALGVEPFRATALAGALGGYLSVLALYLLLREVGSRREWALAGSLFYALTPSVWLHGVRPLSDGPGAAAALFAAVFLVRAIKGKSRSSLVCAAAFTAIAAGVRPQVGLALLPAAAVAAAVVFRRERRARALVLAVAVGVLLSAAIWIPVFRGSGGFAVWKDRFEGQMKYVTEFDVPRARDFARLRFWGRWWLDPVGNGTFAAAFLALALAGGALERRKAGPILLVFIPVTALTLGVLGTAAAPRYALAFWAAPSALAALALERASRRRGGRIVAPAAAILVLAGFAALAVPAVVEAAAASSPSVSVVRAAQGITPTQVFVCPMLEIHAREYLGRQVSILEEARPESVPEGAVFLCADKVATALAPRLAFAYGSALLPRISRGRYLTSGLWDGRARPDAAVRRVDGEIPAAIDEPAEGARLTSPVLARGWCQERGGGRVEPVELRVDGSVYGALPGRRFPRPDVAAAIPEIGDPSAAGWEARLPALGPGRHTLRVTFQAGDRIRIYPERSFVVEDPPRP